MSRFEFIPREQKELKKTEEENTKAVKENTKSLKGVEKEPDRAFQENKIRESKNGNLPQINSSKPGFVKTMAAAPGYAAKSFGYTFLQTLLPPALNRAFGVDHKANMFHNAHHSWLHGESDDVSSGKNTITPRNIGSGSGATRSIFGINNKTLNSILGTLIDIKKILGEETPMQKNEFNDQQNSETTENVTPGEKTTETPISTAPVVNKNSKNAMEGLEGLKLGYKKHEAYNAVQNAVNIVGAEASESDILKQILKTHGKNLTNKNQDFDSVEKNIPQSIIPEDQTNITPSIIPEDQTNKSVEKSMNINSDNVYGPQKLSQEKTGVVGSGKMESYLRLSNMFLKSTVSSLIRIEKLLGGKGIASDTSENVSISKSSSNDNQVDDSEHDSGGEGRVTNNGPGLLNSVMSGGGKIGSKALRALGMAGKSIAQGLANTISQKTGVEAEKSEFDSAGNGVSTIDAFSSQALEGLKNAFKAAISESGGLGGGLGNLAGNAVKDGGLLYGAKKIFDGLKKGTSKLIKSRAGAKIGAEISEGAEGAEVGVEGGPGGMAIGAIGAVGLGALGMSLDKFMPTQAFNYNDKKISETIDNPSAASETDLKRTIATLKPSIMGLETRSLFDKSSKTKKNLHSKQADLQKLENEEANRKKEISKPAITTQTQRLSSTIDKSNKIDIQSKGSNQQSPVVVNSPRTSNQNNTTNNQTNISNGSATAINKGSLGLAFYG